LSRGQRRNPSWSTNPNPNDPYRANDLYRPSRSNFGEDEVRRDAHLDRELQADPELAEGPASGAKIAMLALGIALVLGAVFYGLNNTSVHQARHLLLRRPRTPRRCRHPRRLRACVT